MKKIEYLEDVLKQSAIIPRYVVEETSYATKGFYNQMAFPMTCFCDINITKLQLHSNEYGDYGIGLKKEWMYENIDIEPVHYVNTKSTEVSNLNQVFPTAMDISNKKSTQFIDYLLNTLSYIKPVFSKEKYCFHDEKEWRYIPKIEENNIDKILISDKINDEYIKQSNEKIRNNKKYWIKFSPKQINYLIVRTEKQNAQLIESINNMKSEYDEKQRLDIISKILILDNLGKDW